MSPYGQCADCGAVAWELLLDVSPYCMGCNSSAYQPPDEDDDGWDDEYDGAAVSVSGGKETQR